MYIMCMITLTYDESRGLRGQMCSSTGRETGASSTSTVESEPRDQRVLRMPRFTVPVDDTFACGFMLRTAPSRHAGSISLGGRSFIPTHADSMPALFPSFSTAECWWRSGEIQIRRQPSIGLLRPRNHPFSRVKAKGRSPELSRHETAKSAKGGRECDVNVHSRRMGN
ncbi:hypothetical protein LZ30DRAFT_480123 [Colletotrichum cereale]|nr:hypothetical protein LZ30DRAFT_480123 [Colletotrichum cereale]